MYAASHLPLPARVAENRGHAPSHTRCSPGPSGIPDRYSGLRRESSKSANGPLLKLFDTTWQEDLADDPVEATQLGDARFNDRLPDMSQVAIDLRQKRNYARLQALAKIQRDKLDKADQLNFDLFQRDIKTRIGAYQFKPWMFAS